MRAKSALNRFGYNPKTAAKNWAVCAGLFTMMFTPRPVSDLPNSLLLKPCCNLLRFLRYKALTPLSKGKMGYVIQRGLCSSVSKVDIYFSMNMVCYVLK